MVAQGPDKPICVYPNIAPPLEPETKATGKVPICITADQVEGLLPAINGDRSGVPGKNSDYSQCRLHDWDDPEDIPCDLPCPNNFKERTKPSKALLPCPNRHIPDYKGYIPQLKFTFGETLGNSTHRLFLDPRVAGSRNLSQSDISQYAAEEQWKNDVLDARTHSWGDQKYVKNMVPKYTGYIPKKNLWHFGRCYAPNNNDALVHHELDQARLRMEREFLDDTVESYEPLQPIKANADRFYQRKEILGSPYNMHNDDPNKYMKTGYMGFVPRHWKQFGNCYPLGTHLALNEFTDDVKRQQRTKYEPLTQDKVVADNPRMHWVQLGEDGNPPIYLDHLGLPYGYTGHVPGQKFRHGRTFGRSGMGCKNKSHDNMQTCVLTGERFKDMDHRINPPNCCTTTRTLDFSDMSKCTHHHEYRPRPPPPPPPPQDDDGSSQSCCSLVTEQLQEVTNCCPSC